MPGIVRAPLHAFKYGRIFGCGIDTGFFKALRHDFWPETLHDIVELNFFDNTLPGFPHLRVELDYARSDLLVRMVILAANESCKILPDLMKALGNTFHLPRPLGVINQAELVAACTAHPFAMPANPGSWSLCPEHVMEQDVVGEDNDLTAVGSFLREGFGHSLHAAMVCEETGSSTMMP